MKPSFHVKLFVTIAIHVILTINLTDGYIDFRLTAPRLTPEEISETCKNAGPMGLVCKSCLEIGRCVPNAENGMDIVSQGVCPHGRTCDEGKCISNHICVPDNVPDYVCASTGMFPDPYDCKKYHFCTPDASTVPPFKSIPATCMPDGTQQYGYNPITTFCSTKLLNNNCATLPIPICKKPLDTGIVGNNPSLYYKCLNVTGTTGLTDVLYPYQQKCDFGRRYNVATQECR